MQLYKWSSIIDETFCKNVLCTVDQGLVRFGCIKGRYRPGNLCVQECVSLTLGNNGYKPPCVGDDVNNFLVYLNDINFRSVEKRTKTLRKLAIAQLGSDIIDQDEFMNYMMINTVKKILPRVIIGTDDISTDLKNKCHNVETIKDANYIYSQLCKHNCEMIPGAGASLYALSIKNSRFNIKYNKDQYCQLHFDMIDTSVELAIEALTNLKSPGTKYLYLC